MPDAIDRAELFVLSPFTDTSGTAKSAQAGFFQELTSPPVSAGSSGGHGGGNFAGNERAAINL